MPEVLLYRWVHKELRYPRFPKRGIPKRDGVNLEIGGWGSSTLANYVKKKVNMILISFLHTCNRQKLNLTMKAYLSKKRCAIQHVPGVNG